ncbi:MAG: hypothetical protein FH748_02095 [Balneolaceae bacterium]|nr:hypothetical protein [Balneolaceae bacterium]
MTKVTIGTFLIFLLSVSSYAQDSTGYSNPDDFDLLLNYRLPDWGYSNFVLSTGSFDIQGHNYDKDNGMNFSNFNSNAFNTEVNIVP